ncbi:MAG TPA: LysM peptidoglycan-binding domain-containing protein [Chloroflexia bacterium]
MLSGKIRLFLGGLGLLALVAGGAVTAGDLARPAAQQAGTTYIVQPGDTLAGSAYRAYGDAAAWTCIQAANPAIRTAADLQLGMSITLPSKAACAAGAPQPPTPAAAQSTPTARPTAAPARPTAPPTTAPATGTPPPATPTSPPTAGASVYVIRSGDTLSSIAWRVYGNPGAWPCIWAANQWLTNPRFLLRGWQITLPPAATCDPPAPTPAAKATAAPAARYHVVVSMETLSGIACRYYTDCNYWRIYNANRDKIWNVNFILPGTVLRIP